MIRLTELRLPLSHPEAALRPAILHRLGLEEAELREVRVFRRGYDARNPRAIVLVYTLDLAVRDEEGLLRRHAGDPRIGPAPDTTYRLVARVPEGGAPRPSGDALPALRAGDEPIAPAPGGAHLPRAASAATRPVVIGTGPCGLLAALVLAQMGFRPLILERGRPVRERTRDTWGLWRRGVLEPESNVQFGEGGAGTFSDGKLYSGIKDPRHYGRKVLTEFVKAGAPEEILYVSKPHIGTFRLVTMVESIRAQIEALGGEYRFGTRVVDLLVETDRAGDRRLRGVVLEGGETLRADQVVLAIGHSARDTFTVLRDRGVVLEAKPFSLGVRIEHPQGLIDRARFGPNAGNPLLGAADYRLVHHGRAGRSVYSFCMCPGGRVVAATSEPGRVVTNGMSQYSRAELNANAGLVVGISPGDYPEHVLAGVDLQRHWESLAFEAGGGGYRAPGQLVGDFLAGRASTSFGGVVPSYQPGVTPTDLARCLPGFVVEAMREALPAFEAQIPGFARADAVMTGVETRTSSPVRICRGADLQSVNTPGLFPAGEGAGYAGGILSAGVDGIRVAEALALIATGQPVPRALSRGTDAPVAYG